PFPANFSPSLQYKTIPKSHLMKYLFRKNRLKGYIATILSIPLQPALNAKSNVVNTFEHTVQSRRFQYV
ncbi:hypothetical protein ACOV11_24145, partial [Vibrio natriegens]